MCSKKPDVGNACLSVQLASHCWQAVFDLSMQYISCRW